MFRSQIFKQETPTVMRWQTLNGVRTCEIRYPNNEVVKMVECVEQPQPVLTGYRGKHEKVCGYKGGCANG